jgi:hypothetical protein
MMETAWAAVAASKNAWLACTVEGRGVVSDTSLVCFKKVASLGQDQIVM